MKSTLIDWEKLCSSSGAVRFLDMNLRGVGQVLFQDSPLSGAIFIAAIAWGSFAAATPQTFFAGVIAVVAATLTALWLRVDDGALRSGLYGYNAVLVGIALATFLAPTPILWLYVVLGAAVSTVATLGIANAMKLWSVPALTFPFVLTTWILLLAASGFSGLNAAAPPSGKVVAAFEPYQANPLNVLELLHGVLLSISQIFLKSSWFAALLLILGLAVSSMNAALFAISGAVLAILTAHLLGAESELITEGLLGFSPVLTAIALGSVFYQPSVKVAAYAALGTVFTVITQAALNVALSPLAIPALTAPFVLVLWLFLLPRQCLDVAKLPK